MKINHWIFKFSIAVLLISVTNELHGQSFFGSRSLTPVSIDKLTDNEILLFKKNFQMDNMSQPEALQELQSRGMSEDEIAKLEKRLGRLNKMEESDQLELLSMQLLQLQDSLGGKKRTHMEMSALERLYALDSNVFGAELFRNEKMEFAPNLRIATPPTYRIGPDDEIEITVYGFQEFNQALKVQPSGVINIPYAGVVSLSGLTMKDAKAKIFQQLAKNGYNTLVTGRSELTISIKEVRSVDVTVVGGKIPGRYTIPAIASPYHVLHLAGGPAAKGSYRDIRLIRNGEVVGNIDLYELLINGTKHDDLRLEDGDVIFIPTYSSRVTLSGEFKKPRTFELKEGEKFSSLLVYSGGFSEQAFKEKVYLERTGRVGFVSMVISQEEFSDFEPINGDFFVADTLNDRFRNRISIQGAVQIPGYYASSKGLTIQGLLELAGGLREDADPLTLSVARKDSSERWTYRSVMGEWDQAVVLEGDSITVGFAKNNRQSFEINVRGEVNRPCRLPFGEGLTLAHAINLAGGFTEFADFATVEIGTPNWSTGGVTLEIFDFSTPNAWERAFTLPLKEQSVVSVKRRRNYRLPRVVTLHGEVEQEGAYALKQPGETLSSLIARAGGLTSYANEHGVYIVRTLTTGNTDNLKLEKERNVNELSQFTSREREQSAQKEQRDTISIDYRFIRSFKSRPFKLMDQDEIHIMENTNTIEISGAVYNAGIVSFLPNKSFGYYLSIGGGSTAEGITSNSYVIYPNGISRRSRSVLGVVIYRPKIVSGCKIVVPEKNTLSTSRIDAGKVSMYTGVLSAITTSFIGIVTLLRP